MLGSIALLLTFSRSAWVAFSTALAFFLVIAAKTGQRSLIRNWFSLILGISVLLIPFFVVNSDLLGIRLNFGNSFARVPQETQSIGERQLLFQAGNEIFGSHPFTGIGLSVFPYALSMAYPEFPVDYQPAHFVLLDVAVETGIFGAFFFALLIVAPWIALWLNRAQLNFSPALIGMSGLLLVMTIIGFFDYYPWLLAPGRFLQWFSWGAWAAMYQSSKR
jgi:O-antigen ligase